MSNLFPPRHRRNIQTSRDIEQEPLYLFMPSYEVSENLLIHFTWDGSWIRGEVYPVERSEEKWVYRSDSLDGLTNDRTQGQLLFRFIYCWRGVRGGLAFFPDANAYWGEEVRDMSKAWALLEPELQAFIRGIGTP